MKEKPTDGEKAMKIRLVVRYDLKKNKISEQTAQYVLGKGYELFTSLSHGNIGL